MPGAGHVSPDEGISGRSLLLLRAGFFIYSISSLSRPLSSNVSERDGDTRRGLRPRRAAVRRYEHVVVDPRRQRRLELLRRRAEVLQRGERRQHRQLIQLRRFGAHQGGLQGLPSGAPTQSLQGRPTGQFYEVPAQS
jgi:hypothetical protein